jgi:NitT/TauT family transport system permease protein
VTFNRWIARLNAVAILGGILLVMHFVTTSGLVSTFLLPSPAQIAASIPRLIFQEGLFYRLSLSVVSVFTAAGLAILIGTVVGWGLYRNRNAWLAFSGWIAGLNAAPLILLFPLMLVIFGRGATAIIALGVLGGLPPIMLKSREAFAGARRVLLDVGRSFNLSPAKAFWLIHLPAAAPTMVAGFRLGSFYALLSVIGGEFLTGIGGVGALIPDLAERFQIAAMYGAIVFVILTSAAFITLVKRVERWFRPI